MSVEYNKTQFGSGKGILVYPDHYVAIPITLTKDHSLAIVQAGRKVVKAGTIYPANDATAQGIIMNDIDVTDGDKTAALLIHAFVKRRALRLAPAANALSAMKMLQFIPLAAPDTITLTAPTVAAAFEAGEALEDSVKSVVVAIDNSTFNEAAEDVANWTFANLTDSKLQVTGVVLAADRNSVIVTIKAVTGQTLVAKTITAICSAAAVAQGVAPAAAVNIAVVASA